MSASSISALFSPIRVGNINLQHRVVLAPLTRIRAHANHVPTPQAPAYYSQRGSAPGTLLITEGTFISQRAGGYDNVPGIYTDAHVEGWKKVCCSFIFLQLWALGRTAETAVLAKEDNSPLVNVPRALTTNEIKEYVATMPFGLVSDGVEIHGANGYLIDQFIQDVSNQRTDEYGGSIENRARFALAVTDAVVEPLPWGTFSSMGMADPKPQFSYVVEQLRKHKLAYIHVVEPMPAEVTAEKNSDFLRDIWQGVEGSTFISTNGYTRDTAIET
ncbi:FMN-linked oxidoreductase, partial [Suillus fuscotomentosus]